MSKEPAGHGAGVIPLLLMLLAMLTVLAVVRDERKISLIQAAMPVTRIEFLLGGNCPMSVLGMMELLLMSLLAVTIFGVPVTAASWPCRWPRWISPFATGMGLLASAVPRSQIRHVLPP